MTAKQPPQPRKRPKQSRSQFVFDAIQQACLQILQEEGPDQLSTQRIADVAGVNIASVYQYFPNKEAVLTGVYEDFLKSNAEKTAEQFSRIKVLSQRSIEETLIAIIELETSQLYSLYQLSPEFYKEYSHSFDIHLHVDQLTQSMQNPSWEDWFNKFLSFHHEHLRTKNITTLSLFARNTLNGNIKAALQQNPELLIDSFFKKELLQLLLGYLLKKPTP